MIRIKTYSLEEIRTITNIQLTKSWDIFLTPFSIYPKAIHEESCKLNNLGENEEWDEELCNCNPTIVDALMGRILAWPRQDWQGERKYFYCNIPEEKDDFKNKEWELPPDAMPQILKEDIINGLCTLAEMLKVYEITGDEKYNFFEAKMSDGRIIEGKELSDTIYKEHIEDFKRKIIGDK